MTDDLERDAMRGRRAEQLLADELLQEAFETLKAEYLRAWENTDPSENERREQLWYAHRVVPLVRKHLTDVVKDGTLAKAQIEQMARSAR
jgi:hypothetical protein